MFPSLYRPARILALFVASYPCFQAVSAYQVNEAKWDISDFPVRYWIDPQVAAEVASGNGVQILQAAFQKWATVESSSFDAAFQGLKEGYVAQDQECHLMWADLGGGGPFPPPLGQTFTHSGGGRIWDADIVFNTFYDWTDAQLAITALHEIGHLLGLGHSTSVYAVMHPTSDRSELHFDDIEGVTFLYPSSNLSDLLPVSMLYPLYASPDSSGPLAALIRNAGFPSSITIETTVYISNTPDFSAVTTYIGKEDVHLETSDPVIVHFPRRAFGQAGPLFFGLEVDSARQAFESDETNNLLVVEIPIVPWEANGDENLSGRVEGLDLFEFSRHWLENYQLPWRYRFDFDPRNHVEEDDLLALLGRWRNGTLPR